jgi:hypothetical protein
MLQVSSWNFITLYYIYKNSISIYRCIYCEVYFMNYLMICISIININIFSMDLINYFLLSIVPFLDGRSIVQDVRPVYNEAKLVDWIKYLQKEKKMSCRKSLNARNYI